MKHNALRAPFFFRFPLPQPGGTRGFRQDKSQVLTGDDTHGMVGILDTLAGKVGSGSPRSDFGALGGYSEALRIYPSRARPLYLAWPSKALRSSRRLSFR